MDGRRIRVVQGYAGAFRMGIYLGCMGISDAIRMNKIQSPLQYRSVSRAAPRARTVLSRMSTVLVLIRSTRLMDGRARRARA